MTAQIFLIAPDDADPANFAAMLEQALAVASVAALLLPRGAHGETAYKTLVKRVVPVAQQAGCAVLLEGEPGLVRMLGADGLHLPADAGAVRQALAALKPDFIVGADAGDSRDTAMELGELGVDYLFFGARSAAIGDDIAERAQWWAETMEVPAVYSAPSADPQSVTPHGCEFVALSTSVWTAAEGAGAALDRFAQRLASL